MKSRSDKPRWIAGRPRRRHFKLCFEFRIYKTRIEELKELLASANLQPTNMRVDIESSPSFIDMPYNVLISFRHASDAIWFKLSWTLCDIQTPENFAKVILPIVRRVMPTLIAQDIIGVQSMTAPTSGIYKFRARHGSPPAPAPSLAQPSTLPSPGAE